MDKFTRSIADLVNATDLRSMRLKLGSTEKKLEMVIQLISNYLSNEHVYKY